MWLQRYSIFLKDRAEIAKIFRIVWQFGIFYISLPQKYTIMGMTVREMKQDAVNLIYQVDDKNTDKMEKILLFLRASVVPNNSEEKLTWEQNRRLSELDSLCGVFEDSSIDDNYKKLKEKTLIEKYM